MITPEQIKEFPFYREGPQTAVVNNTKERGYLQGDPEHELLLNLLKLIEEFCESLDNAILPHRTQEIVNAAIKEMGELATEDFKKKRRRNYTNEELILMIETLKEELKDVLVTMFNMAYMIEQITGQKFDLVGEAVKKSREDIKRGVR